jgi:signal transduction histidine kinase
MYIMNKTNRHMSANRMTADLSGNEAAEADIQWLSQRHRQVQLAAATKMSKLVAMEHSISELSHDIGQPLATIVNYLSGAHRILTGADETMSSKDRDRLALAIERSLSQTREIRQLLSSHQQSIEGQSQKPRSVDLVGVIDEIVDELQQSLDAVGATIAIKSSLQEAYTYGRLDQIQQIVRSSLISAIQATRSNTKGENERSISVFLKLSENMYQISFCGPHKSWSTPALNDPYGFFLDDEDVSDGIGLPLVSALASSHGGFVKNREFPEINRDKFHVFLPVISREEL